MENELNLFLESMTYGTDYRVLEAGKDDDELKAIAKKHHLRLPSKSVAIFKGKFAFTDERNKNGCILPKEEVEKALDTIAGTAIDFDHFRKRVVGYWLEGYLEESTIYTYGAFFKGNFPEDFQTISDLLNMGNLKISFEAWGDRIMKSKDTYDLTNIVFAGGALLVKEAPAFANAEVTEMAKLMTKPDKFVIESGTKMEKARYYTFDISTIIRMMEECDCPVCQAKGSIAVDEIDFKKSSLEGTCMNCGAECEVDLKPGSMQMSSNITQAFTMTSNKAVTANFFKELSKDDIISIKKIKVSTDSNKVEESKMDEQKLKELTEKLAALESNLAAKDAELASLKTELESAKAKTVEVEQALEKAKTDSVTAIEQAQKNATLVANRRHELGEFASEMKDEDILDDKNYEIAKLKKENAILKASKEQKEPEKAAEKKEEQLISGSAEKKTEVNKSQKKVHELAFGS